jgi:spermidine synthase
MRCSPRTATRAITDLAIEGEPQHRAGNQNVSPRSILFLLFFLSGFCGLVYQLVWTRMALAAFGIITPVLSVVISVFMLGLSVGSWAGGKWIGPLTRRTGISAVLYYALAEFCIGLGAFLVPRLFSVGEHLLQATGETNSLTYLALSALVLGLSILPWCLLMGATFPLMMAYMREREERSSETFSFLYLANVLGATIGIASAALVLVEIFGFKDTLQLAAAGNFTIAVISVKLGWTGRIPANEIVRQQETVEEPSQNPLSPVLLRSRSVKRILFATGFVSMAMEVVWTRAFAPILKTQVYSFAVVVATYLAATFIGSWIYRRDLRRSHQGSIASLLLVLSVAALLPVYAAEACFQAPKLGLAFDGSLSVAMLLASICPFCGVLGYLTPKLIDDVAAGSPSSAGRAYAANVLGCILGPLVASYGLLTILSEGHALMLLGVPFLAFYSVASSAISARRRLGLGLTALAVLALALFFCRSFEEYVFSSDKSMRSRRDYAASVICVGKGLNKWLLVNGTSMTSLTPITKFMAHLPLAYHQGKPQSALVICFGMGTTFRSALSWDVNTTAVELVPSVTGMFDFFFADAAEYLNNPKGRLVIDDGRRYLKRAPGQFDVIIVDPPPPVEAAGSSLLYSKEFYDLAKQHLRPGGIIQAWVPDNYEVAGAALRSLCDSFPYVRCFGSVQGRGVHMLASMEPIPARSPAELISRMPAAARSDLLEWSNSTNLPAYLGIVLGNEINAADLLPQNPQVRITDDQPFNEYFLLRKQGWW